MQPDGPGSGEILVAGGQAPRDIESVPPPQIADWIDESAETLARQAVQDIWEAVPAYRGSGQEADVAAHCRQVFGIFARSLREGHEPTPEDFPWMSKHTRPRFEADISLVDFLTAFRVGQRTLWEGLRAYSAQSDEAAEMLLGMVTQLMRLIEAGSSAVASSYFELQQHQLADLQRLQRDVLDDLLDGRAPQGLLGQRILTDAGLAEDSTFLLVVARPAAGQGCSDDLSEAVSAATLALAGAGIFVARRGEMVGLVPPLDRTESEVTHSLRRFADELSARGTAMSVGCSTSQAGLMLAADAYGAAALACESLRGRQGLMPIAEVSPLTYLIRRPDPFARRLLREQVVAFFAEDLAGDGIYADTLEAYADSNLNVREAAEALFVHANTVYYRLERITSSTGADLRRLESLVELLLAVRVLRAGA